MPKQTDYSVPSAMLFFAAMVSLFSIYTIVRVLIKVLEAHLETAPDTESKTIQYYITTLTYITDNETSDVAHTIDNIANDHTGDE